MAGRRDDTVLGDEPLAPAIGVAEVPPAFLGVALDDECLDRRGDEQVVVADPVRIDLAVAAATSSRESDMVDDWGRESFPASDPPQNW